MGAVALQKWREAHPEWVHENATRALVKAREANQVRAVRSREAKALRKEQQARLKALFRGYPRDGSREMLVRWFHGVFLKIGADPTLPQSLLSAVQSAYRCVRDLPAESEKEIQGPVLARLEYAQHEVDDWRNQYEEAQSELRELRHRAAGITQREKEFAEREAALEQRANGGQIAVGDKRKVEASPIRVYGRLDADGVHLGRTYESCCAAPGRKLDLGPEPIEIP
jgi:hypothetical protein